MAKPHSILTWIKLGIATGLVASLFYPLLIFAPLPYIAVVFLASFLGPAIGLASLGLKRLLEIQQQSVWASVGAITNFIAGALFTTMLLVQLAFKSQPSQDMPAMIWLGLDVAWDIYIGLGTIFFALAMISHSRFGKLFAIPGLVLGVLVMALNLATFPTPPAEAGSFDIGPLVGIWYLVVTIQSWRSLAWAKGRLNLD